MTGNPLEKLTMDYWYKVLIVGGFSVFLLAGGGLLDRLPLLPTISLSLGLFCIGLGEWINHPLQTTLWAPGGPFPTGKVTGHPRRTSLAGLVFDAVGVALCSFGLYRLLS